MGDTEKESSHASLEPQTIREISLFLMSEKNHAELQVQYGPAGVPAVEELLSLFGIAESDTFSIDHVQVASLVIKKGLDALLTRHAAVTPQLHRLKKFVCDLPDDSHFLLLPASPDSTSDRLECERYIHKLNHPENTANDHGAKDIFGLMLERYDMDYPRTDQPTMIGSSNKAERKCRFCGRTVAEGATFGSVAHVIPTALGNDYHKLADECDECNGYFGRETEPSLIAMLDIPRAFLGTQGRGKKGGRPELRFEHGKLQHDGQYMNIESRQLVRDEPAGHIAVNLGKGAPMIPVAVYRALVKIALSVVDPEALPTLKETIAWVRRGAHTERILPKVMTTIVNLPSNPSAQIVVYRRKGPHKRLPHLVGEFRLGCFLYVFAVPFSEEDSWDLVGFSEDHDFCDTFKHYSAVGHWTQHNLSSSNRVILASKLKFVPRDSAE